MLISEVMAIVFSAGKGLCAKLALYSDLALAIFFSQMTSQRVRLPQRFADTADKSSWQR